VRLENWLARSASLVSLLVNCYRGLLNQVEPLFVLPELFGQNIQSTLMPPKHVGRHLSFRSVFKFSILMDLDNIDLIFLPK